MPEEIPVELQEEFMNAIDDFVHTTLRSTKRRYERRERKNFYQLLLNKVCNDFGEEAIDYVIGSEDIEYDFGFMDSIDNEKLFKALKSLSPRERELIKLRFYDNYTNDEICDIFGYQNSTVRQLISKTIGKLKKCMKDEVLI